MKQNTLLTWLTLSALMVLSFAFTPLPTAEAQSAPTSAVLDYLTGLQGQQVIVGQMGSYGGQTSIATAEEQLDRIFDLTDTYPALTGFDFQRPDQTPEQSIADAVAYAIDKWDAGYLITISWHANNPCTGAGATMDVWDNATQSVIPPLDGLRLLDGGDCRDAWRASLDLVADGLQELEDAGVVVIWRPFHEMNGAWFWWNRQEQATFVAMWVDMYDYFTQTKGLSNLIWAYAPNTPWDEFAQAADFYYPGDAYVDLVGLDHYMTVEETTLTLNSFGGYDQLAALNKPMALTEFGPIPASGAAWDTKAYCWNDLIGDIQSQYPKIVYFLAWEYVWQIGRDPFTCQQELMDNAAAVTLDNLPSF